MKLTSTKFGSLSFCFALVIVLQSVSTGQAQATVDQDTSTWYEVSLVVFKNRNSPLGNEKWRPPAELQLAYPEGAVLLEPQSESPDKKRVAFQTVAPTDKEFNEVLSSLNLSSSYEIITSQSWLQPALDSDHAVPVLIQGGKEYEGLFELAGSVTLIVSRYLHLKTDLWLSEYIQKVEVVAPWWQDNNATPADPGTDPAALGSATEPAAEDLQPYANADFVVESSPVANDRFESIQTVELKQSRRMRSGELHYLDNPLFGVIVKVTPQKAKLN